MQIAYSPNNVKIVARCETVPCDASITGLTNDGEPIYAGESDMHWEDQHPVHTENNETLWVDEDGSIWPWSQLHFTKMNPQP